MSATAHHRASISLSLCTTTTTTTLIAAVRLLRSISVFCLSSSSFFRSDPSSDDADMCLLTQATAIFQTAVALVQPRKWVQNAAIFSIPFCVYPRVLNIRHSFIYLPSPSVRVLSVRSCTVRYDKTMR